MVIHGQLVKGRMAYKNLPDLIYLNPDLLRKEGARVRPFQTAAVSLRRAIEDSEGSGGGEP